MTRPRLVLALLAGAAVFAACFGAGSAMAGQTAATRSMAMGAGGAKTAAAMPMGLDMMKRRTTDAQRKAALGSSAKSFIFWPPANIWRRPWWPK